MGAFRSEMLLEVALIWVLVIATLHVGWWAPVVVGLAITTYLGIRPAAPAPPDPLTGLQGKATFLANAERKVRSIRRGTLTGATLLLIDIREFHRVNEERGHEAGDAALRVTADRLRSQFPGDGDLLGRLINDRFCVLVPGLTTRNAAIEIARELVAAIGRPISTQDGPLTVAAAVGIVLVPAVDPTQASVGTLMVRAEQALALAKDEGGGSSAWHLWSPDDRLPFGG
jgi:diguanylate cyclase